MSYLFFIIGMVVSTFLFSGLFSLILWIKKIDTKINFSYFFFAVFSTLYIFFSLLNSQNTDIKLFIVNEKILDTSILLAGIFFIELISNLTRYKPKKLIITLRLIFGLLIVLSLALPYGITFATIEGFNKNILYENVVLYTVKGELNSFYWFLILFIAFLIAYAIKSMHYLFTHGGKQDFKLLLISMLVGLSGVLADNFLRAVSIKGLFFIEDFAFIGFVGIITERNFRNIFNMSKIKQDLGQSEERFRILFENANDAILIMKRDMFIDCNGTAVKMFGYEKEKIIGESPIRFSPPLQPDGVQSKVKAIEKIENALNGVPQRFEWRHINSKGNSFDTEVSLVRIELSGQFLLHASVRDITERKKAEEALKLSEQKQRTLFDLAADPILLLEFDGKIIDLNQAAYELMGIDKSQLQNINIIDLNSEDSKPKVKERLFNIKEMGKYVFDTTLVNRDGKIIPIEVNATTIEYEKRDIILAIHRDMTIRLQAEEILRNSEEKYRNIIQTAVEGFFIIDTNGKILEVNNAWEKMFGYHGSSLRNLNLSDIEAAENAAEIELHLKKIIDQGYDRFETKLKNKNGDILFTDVSVTFSKSNNLFYSFLSDITERKKIEEEILKNQLFINRVTDQSPDIIYIYDVLKDKNIYTNKNIGKMLGYGENEFPVYDNEFFNNIIHPDDLVQFNNFHEKINEWEKEFIFEFEYRMKDKNGEWRWFTGKEKEFQRNEGKIISIIGTVSEITDKKKYEEALVESEQRYRLLSDMTVEGIALHSQGLLYDANETFLEMVGYKREDLIGKDVIPIIFPKDQIENARQLNMVERDYPLEFKYITSNGVERIAEFRYKNMEYKGHNVRFTSVYDITERKIFEKKLQESEERFRLIAENSTDMIAKHKLDGEFIYVSPSCKRILGYEPDELIGRNPFEYYYSDDIPSIRQSLNKILTDSVIDTIAYRFKKKDGSYIWFETTSTAILDLKNGKPYEIQTSSRDITDRKKIELSLDRSEKNLRKIFETAPFGIAISNVHYPYNILACNDSYLDIVSLRREDLIGNPAPRFIDEAALTVINKEFLRKGYLDNFEFLSNNDEGERYWSISLRNITYDNKPANLSVIQNITSIKRTEKELETYSQFIKYVINSVPVAIVSADSRLNVTLFNHYSENFMADTDSLYLFEKFPKLMFIKEILNRSIEKNDPITDTMMITGEEGEIKYFNIVISPLISDFNPGSVILVEDMTEMKRMERVMIQSEKVMSVAGLAAGMAHEINNPLGTIVQGCQNILRRISKDLHKNIQTASRIGIDINIIETYFRERQIFEIIESMRSAAGKASEIVKNMLQFSRRSESKKVMYDLTQLVDQVIELAQNDYDLKKKYDFKSIKIIKEFENDIPMIKLTVTEIEQVIFNILSNAAQAMRQYDTKSMLPTIIIRLIKEIQNVRIEIEDNGPGMNDKIKNRIFEPFFTTKEPGEGTGLGLSVAYMIITTNHSGTISVNSEVGKGTTFIIRLPY